MLLAFRSEQFRVQFPVGVLFCLFVQPFKQPDGCASHDILFLWRLKVVRPRARAPPPARPYISQLPLPGIN